MKIKSLLNKGGITLMLFAAAGLVQAKPDIHEIERLSPHKQIERHLEKRREKNKTHHKHNHYSDSGRRLHDGKGNSKKHEKWKDKRVTKQHYSDKHRHNSKHDRHRYSDRHHNSRYYNGWNNGSGRDWHKDKRKHYYGHDKRAYYGHDKRHHYHDEGRRFHHGYPQYRKYWGGHKRHGYRHKVFRGNHYYFNNIGFMFPGLGMIEFGHRHDRHCPDWHLEHFVAGAILSAVLHKH